MSNVNIFHFCTVHILHGIARNFELRIDFFLKCSLLSLSLPSFLSFSLSQLLRSIFDSIAFHFISFENALHEIYLFYVDMDSDNKSDGMMVDNEILFPIINEHTRLVSTDSRHTNTPKSYNSGSQYISKFMPRDQEDMDDDDVISNTLENKYNHEEAELDIDQITMRSMSFVSRENGKVGQNSGPNDDLKLPEVIKEGDENEETSEYDGMNGIVDVHYPDDDDDDDADDDHTRKHLEPHIVDDDDNLSSADSRNMSSAEMDNNDNMVPMPMDDDNRSSDSEHVRSSNFQSLQSPPRTGPKFEQQDEDSDLEIETPLPNKDDPQIRAFNPFNKHQSVPTKDLYSHNALGIHVQSFHPGQSSQSRSNGHILTNTNNHATSWQTLKGKSSHMNVNPNHSPCHTTPSPHENIHSIDNSRPSLNSSHSKHSKNSRKQEFKKFPKFKNSRNSKDGQELISLSNQDLLGRMRRPKLQPNVYSVPTPNRHHEERMPSDPLASVGLYTDEDINPGVIFSDSQVT